MGLAPFDVGQLFHIRLDFDVVGKVNAQLLAAPMFKLCKYYACHYKSFELNEPRERSWRGYILNPWP